MTDATTSSSPESASVSAASPDANGSMTLNTGVPKTAAPENPIVGGENGVGKSVSDILREKVDGASKDAKAPADRAANEPAAAAAPAPVVPADVKPAYVPNLKYKVAGQEKDLDPFWHPLVKDPESEKKVKELLSKVDAFDFVKGKKDHFEQQYATLNGDYEALSTTVNRFDSSLKNGDLTSAFRIAGINKEQVFKWVNQQLQYMELPPEQRAQIEAAENARAQNFDYEEKLSRMENQYQTQAVQTRTMQLDMALMKPEVATFATSWDQNAEPGFTFRDTVAQEARRIYYESGQDLSPEQAVAMVMGKFGRFVTAGEAAGVQPPQAATPAPRVQTPPPVIPNVTGKAASPIKKAFKNLDELRAHEKSMPG